MTEQAVEKPTEGALIDPQIDFSGRILFLDFWREK